MSSSVCSGIPLSLTLSFRPEVLTRIVRHAPASSHSQSTVAVSWVLVRFNRVSLPSPAEVANRFSPPPLHSTYTNPKCPYQYPVTNSCLCSYQHFIPQFPCFGDGGVQMHWALHPATRKSSLLKFGWGNRDQPGRVCSTSVCFGFLFLK